MVALLLQIGKEAILPDIVPMILASRDCKELAKYALFAPPHGLCLVTVNYNEEYQGLPSSCPKTSSIPRQCRRRPEALARPKARKGVDEHGDRAGQSNDARLVRWQRGPEAPNPHDVLHPRPRARPRGPHQQRGGREACVGYKDSFEVCNTGTRISSERRSKQRRLEARRTVRCASTEPAKPCNPTTTHTLSRTLDRNTTKRTPQRQTARPAVHEEASSGAESASLGVENNTTKPRACKDGSSSRTGPMVAVGLASHNNW
nr:hypothetical protein CFP56_74724 [Quercus suber]